MENRSHALMAGLFTLLLVAAAILVALWLGNDRAELKNYELVSASSVNGLSPQSAVRYQGMPVGKVLSLAVNADRPGQVRIRIGVAPDTPITAATWAELATQGVTGVSYVELRDDGTSRERLVSQDGQTIVIPLRPGLFERLEMHGGAILSSIKQVTEQFGKVMSEPNVQALHASLQNAADITQNLKGASADLGPALRRVGPLVDSIENVSRQADRTAQEIGDLARDARLALARLNAPDGPLNAATQSMQSLARASAQLSGQTLPQVDQVAGQVGRAAQSLDRTIQNVGNSPQSLLFGAPAVQPGPGEPGFAGFRRTQ